MKSNLVRAALAFAVLAFTSTVSTGAVSPYDWEGRHGNHGLAVKPSGATTHPDVRTHAGRGHNSAFDSRINVIRGQHTDKSPASVTIHVGDGHHD
jgi:hypothetical protein